jgi:hypothetical protein
MNTTDVIEFAKNTKEGSRSKTPILIFLDLRRAYDTIN